MSTTDTSIAVKPIQPFHIAFPVHSIASARAFYGGLLECPEGRSSDHWVDFDLFGHQIVAHLDASSKERIAVRNSVDGDDVPVPHFGVVLSMAQWEKMAANLRAANLDFVIEPHIRFKGLAGEQATMFFLDPSGNALEFKAFANLNQLFTKQ
jgi:uncharacterized protein